MKIHKSAIMALDVVHGVIFTGSTDSSIKVWTFTHSDTVQLTQVGQFFSPSPVTSLKAMSSVRKDGSILLLAGDQLGNIHQLIWRS
uniref:TEP-1 C-terminal beta-propeller domain-containing protein n=1 Tax=Arion vulgaris TaxID=1028688 RepID=A0A0B6YZI0_9EUPU